MTHVICENLSGSKTDKALRSSSHVKYVRPEWILDSIKKGKRWTAKSDASVPLVSIQVSRVCNGPAGATVLEQDACSRKTHT